MLEAAILVVFPFCMVFAAVSDMVSMTIANRVSILLVLAFAVLAPLTGIPWSEIGMHFAAGAVVLAVTFAIFATGAMGGGDAKLMSASAVWFGFSLGLANYLLVVALLGGLLTIALLMFRNSGLALLVANNLLLRHFADEKAGIPYGVALGLGGLVTFGQTPLMQWAMARLATG
ncbi:prepilin peptidase [Chelativorans sp. AA-79]|uniref:A24 family peptidase n=1 Tax=Chelativorans sp. AA-79 TaxID=3028735 RepID=UPI0023F8EE85|nr:prepilin peptidase [Chelativorans sp. AA-79]WEX09392.1 prepilin peptidase [Chelativorans sp. AA-79]